MQRENIVKHPRHHNGLYKPEKRVRDVEMGQWCFDERLICRKLFCDLDMDGKTANYDGNGQSS